LNILQIQMGVRYIAISALSTVLSFVGLQFWTELSLDKLKSDGLIGENFIHSENASRVIELLLGSYAIIGLLTNFVLNVFIFLVLCLKVSLLFHLGILIIKQSIFRVDP
jgi:autocrine motility factor receptor